MRGLSKGFLPPPDRGYNESRPTPGETSGASSSTQSQAAGVAGQITPDSFPLLKPDTITELPLLPNARGEFVPTKFTVRQALAKLDRQFPQQPDGPLTSMLRQADPTKELHPRITIAIFTAPRMYGQETLTPRNVAEQSMLAQERTNFPFNGHEVLMQNHGRKDMPTISSYPNVRKMCKNSIQAYYDKKVLKRPDPAVSPAPAILDVGAGFGSTAKYLKKDGFNVTSIDPNADLNRNILLNWKRDVGKQVKPAKLAELAAIIPTTVEKYATDNPGKKFDVVHMSNTAPTETGNSTLISMVHAIAQLTARSGKALIGFSNRDPHFIANPQWPAAAILRKQFKIVNYIDASTCNEFNRNYSVGGMVGFFECKKPKK